MLTELEVPDGMAVIVRTAGAGRSKAEIKRDYEYLIRLWSSIRETTLQSTAPTLVYEEASLIKRSIRDLYDRDIEEIIVQGDEEYRIAKEFMKLFISSHAKRVKLYEDAERRCFRSSASKISWRRCTSRSCSCAPAATSSSIQPKRWSLSTSTPAARPASATSRRRRCGPTWRPRTRSPGSCGCATSPASSSSTSSTWKTLATRGRSSGE